MFSWVRRSRSGFGWTDAVDAPLGEASELYAVTVSAAGRLVRTATVFSHAWRYSAADRTGDGLSGRHAVTLAVAQIGALAGSVARADFILS